MTVSWPSTNPTFARSSRRSRPRPGKQEEEEEKRRRKKKRTQPPIHPHANQSSYSYVINHPLPTHPHRHKCCMVYGSLPSETRSAQARIFNEEGTGYDVLVASDAIGMGLNLNIKYVDTHPPTHLPIHQAWIFNEEGTGYDVLVASDVIGMGLDLNIKCVDTHPPTSSTLPPMSSLLYHPPSHLLLINRRIIFHSLIKGSDDGSAEVLHAGTSHPLTHPPTHPPTSSSSNPPTHPPTPQA